ncbi:MAG: nucleotidyl transferase AbiEii/AbiGii toxin family protein [Planctomycetota bacterium]|jgi:predicted nucleotidyltransferase component of viral defense system
MKDYLRQIISDIQDNNLRRCLIREYLQVRLLQTLQDSGLFTSWVFVDGTALRFLYSMPRFSEDLDFSLVRPGIKDNFDEVMKKIEADFEAENYLINIKSRSELTVKSAFIKFERLLFELGCSPHESEVISIKVEIDTNPPDGADITSSIVRKHLILNLQHYDKASLLAGKLHAILSRQYVKGGDVYDLIWYLSDRSWPPPNTVLLNNALKQTGWTGQEITETNWRQVVADKVNTFNWDRVVTDVRPFMERQEDVEPIRKNTVIELLTG